MTDQRISTQDRELAQQRLSVALMDDYLDVAEYEQRVEAVVAARTAGTLDQVFGDLQRVPSPAVVRGTPEPERAMGETTKTIIAVLIMLVAAALIAWPLVDTVITTMQQSGATGVVGKAMRP